MSRMEPIRRPPTWTVSPLTSCPAVWKSSVYSCVVPPPIRTTASATSTRTTVSAAATRLFTSSPPCGKAEPTPAVVQPGLRHVRGQPCSLHPERPTRRARKELPHEQVVGVEELLGGAGPDDAALPQHRDVLGDAARGHDVVGDERERRHVPVGPLAVAHHLLVD